MLATPDSFRLNQSPLGAYRLPQAPTTVGHAPLPEGLSITRVGWKFPRLSPIPRPSHSSSRIPGTDVGLVVLLVVANAIATWRQAKVCLRPLSS